MDPANSQSSNLANDKLPADKTAGGDLQTRRSFLDLIMKGGLLAWLAAMVMPALVYIWPARASGGRTNLVSGGPIKDFTVGSARMAQAEGKPIVLIRKEENVFVAFSAICTHLGCIVKWDTPTRQIQCPCHAAVFDADGRVVSGPPPAPLQSYDVVIVSGEVMVKI